MRILFSDFTRLKKEKGKSCIIFAAIFMESFSREILWLKKKKRISRRVHIVIEILNFKDMFRRENMQI